MRKMFVKLNALFFLRNKLRLILTVVGMTIGLLLYTVGYTLIEEYIEEQYRFVDAYMDNTYIIQNSSRPKVESIAKKIEDSQIIEYYTFGNLYFDVLNSSKYKNVEIDNMINYIGVNKGISDDGIIYDKDYTYYCTKPTLLYGRDIRESDVFNCKKVIIIEKSISSILFGKENGVGKRIKINSLVGVVEYEVIGIIDDLPCTQDNNVRINNYSNENKDIYENMINGYVPASTLIGIENDLNIVFCIKTNKKNAYDEIKQLENTYVYDTNAIFIEGKKDKKIQFDINWNNIRYKMITVLIIINTIMSLIIMVVYLFGMKERFYEIGVRRAMGASKIDIFNQLMLEGVIVGILIALITIVLSIFSCNIIGAFLIRKALFFDKIVISLRTILSTVCLAIVMSMFCSFISALYAVSVDPIKILNTK